MNGAVMYFSPREGVWDTALLTKHAVCVHMRLTRVDLFMCQKWVGANVCILFALILTQRDRTGGIILQPLDIECRVR